MTSRLPSSEAGPLDSMPSACHIHAMANLQVKNIPASLHRRLRQHARSHHCTIGEIVIAAVERELARNAFRERLAKRPTTNLGSSTTSFLEEERRQRDRDLG